MQCARSMQLSLRIGKFSYVTSCELLFVMTSVLLFLVVEEGHLCIWCL